MGAGIAQVSSCLLSKMLQEFSVSLGELAERIQCDSERQL